METDFRIRKNEMKKAVFFDADGTLIDIREGMTGQTKQALYTLLERGHRIFLCTGRGRAFVPEELSEIPFSGMVCSMGAYLELDGKCVFSKEIPLDAAKKSVETLRRYGLVPVLEGAEYMYYDRNEYTTEIDWYADLITEQLGERLRPITGNESCLHYSKISAKQTEGSDAERACEELEEYYDYIFHEGAFVGKTVEMIVKGCSKGVGMAVLCGVLGIPKEDTVAFGDSNNDLEMFEAAGYKIAMGDASSKLKECADYITSVRQEEGIAKGLRHLGLI